VPKVIIESKETSPLEIDAPDGGALADLCDDTKAPIPFSCRSANCGTCRIDVLDGMSVLIEPEDEELDVLDIFADDPKKRRLACCVKLRAAAGLVRVRPVDD
jgi:ferredoxin